MVRCANGSCAFPPWLGPTEGRQGSLEGEADFHALEIAGDRIYGYNATSGQLISTTDRRSWKTITTGQYVDLAAIPSQPDRVLATTLGVVSQSSWATHQIAGSGRAQKTPQGRVSPNGSFVEGTAKLRTRTSVT
jgi:hypothetical protein